VIIERQGNAIVFMSMVLVKRFCAVTAMALSAVILATGLSGCATSSNPNDAEKYHFPSDGTSGTSAAAPAPAPTPAPSSGHDGQPATAPTAAATPAPAAAPMQSSMLRVGDMITISFSDVPVPPGLAEIRARIPANGMLTLHYNVQVKAADKTIPDLERDIRDAYVPRLFKQFTAIVRSEERFFFVGGEVKTPGRIQLQADLTVLRAIEAAGSFTDFSNRRKIELRRENGQRFFIDERKAKENPALDLPVMANDHITVKRRIF